MQPSDAPRKFWEQRLDEDWTETGVGYRALGRPFNRWMYRVRREVFLREAGHLPLDPSSARVLDVGSGTGFYVERWRELRVGSITGCDITDAGVQRLRRRFPDVPFHRLDISDAGSALPSGSFDAVSCVDVLFHIVDDERYEAAVGAIAGLLRPGGYLLLSENFVHGREQRGPRQVNRSLTRITDLLDLAGLEVLRRVPMLVLMNAHVDARPLQRKAWGAVLRAATVTPPTGWLAGAALYPLERRLVRQLTEGPTTELAVCQRR